MTKKQSRKLALEALEYHLNEIANQDSEYWTDRQYEKAIGMSRAFELVEVITRNEHNFYVDIALATVIKTLKNF